MMIDTVPLPRQDQRSPLLDSPDDNLHIIISLMDFDLYHVIRLVCVRFRDLALLTLDYAGLAAIIKKETRVDLCPYPWFELVGIRRPNIYGDEDWGPVIGRSPIVRARQEAIELMEGGRMFTIVARFARGHLRYIHPVPVRMIEGILKYLWEEFDGRIGWTASDISRFMVNDLSWSSADGIAPRWTFTSEGSCELDDADVASIHERMYRSFLPYLGSAIAATQQ